MSVRIDENTDHMKYTDDMEAIDSDIMDRVIAEMNSYDADIYTAKDVKEALAAETCSVDNFKALLSPAALPFLEEIAQKAQKETRKHFGNSVAIFTPLYIANYCENYCVYCGFNCHNKIKRAQLNAEEIEKEMQAIAETGLEEVLILTGESPNKSSVEYIGEACKIAKKYFKLIGLEVYPMDSKDYAYLHECGADFVTVFQETYNSDKYKTLHLGGQKENIPIPSQCSGTSDHGWNERCWICCSLRTWMILEKMHWQQECMHIFYRKNIHMQKSHFHVLDYVRSLITIRSIQKMFMNHSFYRLFVHIESLCHLQVLRSQHVNVKDSVTTSFRSQRRRFQQE